MLDLKKVDWEKLKNPSKSFSVFVPSIEKITFIKQRLFKDYLNMSDETRNYNVINSISNSYFLSNQFNVFYEIKGFAGLVGFVDVIPEFKSRVMMMFWDKKAFTPGFVKDSRDLFRLFSKEFQLYRLFSQTADERVERMAKLAGFKKEGTQKHAFMWKGKLMPVFQLGMTFDKKRRHG